MGRDVGSDDLGYIDLDAFPDVDPDTALTPDVQALIDARLASSPSPQLSGQRWSHLIDSITSGDVDITVDHLAVEAMRGPEPFDVEDGRSPFAADVPEHDGPFQV